MDSYTMGYRKLAEDMRKQADFCRKTAALTNAADKQEWLMVATDLERVVQRYEDAASQRESQQEKAAASK
jgi:hypothetical protein